MGHFFLLKIQIKKRKSQQLFNYISIECNNFALMSLLTSDCFAFNYNPCPTNPISCYYPSQERLTG